jgi:hypothetical protein
VLLQLVRQLDRPSRPVAADSYIAVIRSPQQTASLKLCVIR